jgi:hypothetical protein
MGGIAEFITILIPAMLIWAISPKKNGDLQFCVDY